MPGLLPCHSLLPPSSLLSPPSSLIFPPALTPITPPSHSQIANLVATFTYSALAAGGGIVLLESRRKQPRTQWQQCVALASAAGVMASLAAAQGAFPVYSVLLLARLVQGAVSQFAWATALTAAASLGPLFDVKATAWVMAGNSLGELLGPQFGSKLYSLGGVRLPFLVASGTALLLSSAFSASARALRSSSRGAIKSAPPMRRPAGAPSPLKDRSTIQLCVGLALSCGCVRSLLDNLLPLYLLNQHSFSISKISNVMLCAALCLITGSAMSGFLLARRPDLVESILIVAAFATSVVTATVFLPSSGAHSQPASLGCLLLTSSPQDWE
ncbi:MAG: hypothetical protein SGPRY_010394 [Prymnesium sp.]